MMILKSFYRKKRTKIYFIIFTSIFAIMALFFVSNAYYTKKGNEAYQNSFLMVSAPRDTFSSLMKIKNIKKVDLGVKIVYGSTWEIYQDDTSFLKENEIIAPFTAVTDKNLGDTITIQYNHQDFSFVLTNKSNSPSYSFRINSDAFNKITSDSFDFLYKIHLKNWFDYKKTKKELEKMLSLDEFDVHIYSQNITIKLDYEFILFVIDILSKIFTFLFFIIFSISLYNIYVDEKKIAHLYFCLGYSKSRILLNTWIKILSLLFLASILCCGVTVILMLFIL